MSASSPALPGVEKPLVKCTKCSSALPPAARYCPRCGTPAKAGQIPWVGIFFLLGLLFGPAAVVSGLYYGNPVLIYGGLIVSGIVVMLVLLGLLF